MKKKLAFILAICIFCCIFAYATEIKQAANEALWWVRFYSLSPEEQDCINFRPSRDVDAEDEKYPTETEKADNHEFD